MRIIIVSGLSGSGKSIALQTLEDIGYYCVDNLPITLLKAFAGEILRHGQPLSQTTAIGIDARNFLGELERFPAIIEELRSSGLKVEIVFLQAADEVLLKRYSETRRKHPLSLDDVPLLEAIRQERQLLACISAYADLIIDTSLTNVHELRRLLRQRLHEPTTAGGISILFESFGFKKGTPADADFIFDVRCLPNPYWEPQLRPLTGLDEAVIDFLNQQPEVLRMLEDLRNFLLHWLPHFERGDRSYLTIAIGCTGGQHRSVFIVEALANYFRQTRRGIMIRHRELP
ncbi:MAG: RNase adapter RapZ [Candidatus Competibacteraceae bacterium]